MRRNLKIEKLLKGEKVISKEPGNSMTPLIKSKQPVEISPCKPEDIKVGDIVYCKVKGNVYEHLVKAINPKRGFLIGNNHGHINGWTSGDKIYGKVTKIFKES